MTAYTLWITIDGKACYAGTAWTLAAAQEVLKTYAERYGWPGYYTTQERR